MLKNNNTIPKTILLISSLLTLSYSIYFGYQYYTIQKNIHQSIKTKIINEIIRIEKQLEPCNITHINIKQILLESPLNQLGYPFFLKNNKSVLFHTNDNEYTLLSLISPSDHETIENKLRINQPSDNSIVIIKNIKNKFGQPIWLVVSSTECKGLAIGVIIFESEIHSPHAKQSRRILLNLIISILLFLLSFLLALSLFYMEKTVSWWLLSFLISGLLFMATCLVWYLAKTYPIEQNIDQLIIFSPQQTQIESITKTEPITVPTGILINYAQFARSENTIYPGALLSGYIWQHYDKKNPHSIEQAFLFPSAGSIDIKELSRQTINNIEQILWFFSGTFYQSFDLRYYPFDNRSITLPIIHKNFVKNVVLVPDFTSYDTLNPELLLGIEQNLTIPYWHLQKSFFSFKQKDFATTLGNDNFSHEKFPILQFNIEVSRSLTGAFISYVLLLLVTMIILFITLMAFFKHQVLTNLLGFSTLGILGVCSTLLFVLLSSQKDLRDHLAIAGSSYLEYLYYICYFLILLIAIDSILFAVYEKFKFIQYKDNLIVKLAYWPIAFFLIFALTLWHFY